MRPRHGCTAGLSGLLADKDRPHAPACHRMRFSASSGHLRALCAGRDERRGKGADDGITLTRRSGAGCCASPATWTGACTRRARPGAPRGGESTRVPWRPRREVRRIPPRLMTGYLPITTDLGILSGGAHASVNDVTSDVQLAHRELALHPRPGHLPCGRNDGRRIRHVRPLPTPDPRRRSADLPHPRPASPR